MQRDVHTKSTVSVVMTTYEGDDVDNLESCFSSLIQQQRPPDEVIIVRDQKLPAQLVSQISNFKSRASFTVRDLCVQEQGRGHARKIGVKSARSEFVAITDADDLSCPDRLNSQLDYFESNPSTDVVGGYISEFEFDPSNVKSVRKVPTQEEKIRKTALFRCPINHQTVMFRRDAVLSVGNYREMEYGEDYELWCRLLESGKKISNMSKVLAKARAGDLTSRRKGKKIACREVQLQCAIVQSGFYGWGIALVNLVLRLPLRFLPNQILDGIYSNILRS